METLRSWLKNQDLPKSCHCEQSEAISPLDIRNRFPRDCFAALAMTTSRIFTQSPGIFLLQVLVFWPVWQWYFAKLSDPAEDASVLVALGTAIVFLLWKKSTQRHPRIPLRIPIILLLLYTVTFPLFSPLLRAMIAVFTLSYTLNYWWFGNRLQVWLYGLLLLSLPVLSPMQFYLSYPVRIIVGRLATLLLQVFGFQVVLEGIAFNWGGEYIWLDELCSGIRKLWAGLYFTFALVAFYDLETKKTIAVTGFAVLAFIMANVLRTTFLFYVKADFFAEPWWLHKSGGMLMFLLAAIATVCFAQWVKKERIAHETHEIHEKEKH